MRKVKNKGFKGLTRKQLDVIEDLFEGNGKDCEVIRKHNVSRRVYRKWMADENFINELAFRAESSRRQGEMLIAKHATTAAVKLIELTRSKKEETSRKACLDIISHPGVISIPKAREEKTNENINTETAEKLLAAMAKQERGNNV